MIGEPQLIPHEGDRVETGPVQFGELDWPGIFIRGDNALAFAHHLRICARACTDPINAGVVKSLATLLESCRVPFGADPGIEVGGTTHGNGRD